MKLLFYVLIGLQVLMTLFVLKLAARNDIEEVRETGYRKINNQLSSVKRKHIRRQVKKSNFSKEDEICIRHPGVNSPIQHLNFWDAFRSRQLQILWLLQFCLSACTTLFCVMVIHQCTEVLDKNHYFCKNTLIATLVAGLLAPLFGLSNDALGIRFNSSLGTIALAVCAFSMAQYDMYTDLSNATFLVALHTCLAWQTTTISYACVHLYGIKCGLFCLSYVKTATLAAVGVVLTLTFKSSCFNNGTC